MTKQELLQRRNEILEKVNQARNQYDDELEQIDKQLWEIKLQEAKQRVGSCYYYPNNCYSCPKSAKDYWHEFYKIVDVVTAHDQDVEYECYKILNFSKDCDGNIKIRTYQEGISSNIFMDDCYKPMLPTTFDIELENLLKELKGGINK